MNKNYIKIILLGDGRVGKTSILNKYINNIFNDSEEVSINCSYFQKNLDFNNQKFTFCLWDTAGQEKFNALNSIYYRDAKGAILVYDVSIKETFKKVEKWMNELKLSNKDCVIYLAGNKIDKNQFDIDNKTISDFCNDNNLENVFTSAKTGEGLEEVFYKTAEEIASRMKSEDKIKKTKTKLKINLDESIHIKNKNSKNDDCC